MRLSDILSKPPTMEFYQVYGFLTGRKCSVGQQIKLDVGQVALNFFCQDCEDFRTFYSEGKMMCLCVNKHVISIDCVLACKGNPNVQVWFLVESQGDITASAPCVRIMKRTIKFPDTVRWNNGEYGKCSVLLSKARQAYEAGLGAGALVYLRKVFEAATVQAANAIGLEYQKYEGGNPKYFKQLLEKVDKQSSIIPQEFSSEGYQLYRDISEVVHGDLNEEIGLAKFEPMYRLVEGILNNIKRKEIFRKARETLGWDDDGGALV